MNLKSELSLIKRIGGSIFVRHIKCLTRLDYNSN
jgi:hypothetical protein